MCQAQDADSGRSTDRSGLAAILSFETEHAGGSPGGWGGGPPGTIYVDGKVVHSGRWSARIERHTASPGGFSTITKSLPTDFAGTTIELRGFLRTEDVSDFVGLWMREDGESSSVAFDNMHRRQLKGTTDWAEYSITLPVRPDAKQLFFGVLLSGTGKAWADDLRLLVDGKPIWEAPRAERPKTALDLDHEFDGGSGIVLKELTKVQIENLATLGKVWGFLKYHHPQVTSGQHHWDYHLLRVLPAMLAARHRTAANAALRKWIAGLAAVDTCNPCAKLVEGDLHLRPELDWIADEALLGTDLCQSLRSIHRNRPAAGRQFYVSLGPGAGNPSFDHELDYKGLKLPDAGFQILGLYRFWNIIQYWFPYRDVLGEDWDEVLTQFIPRIASAKKVAYLKLSSVKIAEAARYIEAAAGTKGLIIDIRNYPSEFVVFALGSLLVEKQTEFARFTTGDLSNPGAFHWTKPVSLSPQQPHYSGKVVILVDETSISQAEYTSMAFRAAPQAMVVGSTTAGADGNVSPFGLPGGLRAMITGIGVFYPDNRPTQRIGIVPDVEVRPTIAGIRAAREEVLEEALRRILGPETAAA